MTKTKRFLINLIVNLGHWTLLMFLLFEFYAALSAYFYGAPVVGPLLSFVFVVYMPLFGYTSFMKIKGWGWSKPMYIAEFIISALIIGIILYCRNEREQLGIVPWTLLVISDIVFNIIYKKYKKRKEKELVNNFE
ncbi:MAG: hypothetical protein IJO64_00140 [Clostridia bacterium]|nr:hypothetical protein [Clostridia bacterium]